MPETRSVPCGLRVLVDHATNDIASADPESVEVSDGLGQRLE
ncbi:MAG: hypothetical protein ACRDOU_00910 [Streptosporangiaceae bacterium]